MPLKCKLVERNTDPTDKSSPKKWYGTTQSAAPLSGKAMTKAATKNTTLAPVELEAALDLLADFIPEQLLQGHTVTIPGLGYFRLTFRSKGADTVQEFNAKEMIYDVRPLFMPSAEFRNRIKEYRARHNMKQEELARLVGVRRETIGNLEKGRYNPSLVLAWNIAQVFGVSIEEIFTVEPEQQDRP